MLGALAFPFNPPPAQPPIRPPTEMISELARTPGYPICISLDIDLTKHQRTVTRKTVNNITWIVATKIVEEPHEINNVKVTLICDAPRGSIVAMKYDFQSESVFLRPMMRQSERIVLTEKGNTLMWNHAYSFPRTRENEAVTISSKRATLKVTIRDIEMLKEFSWHNQVWPFSTHWLVYNGIDKTPNAPLCAVRVHEKDLAELNPRLLKLKTDLNKKILTEREMNALYEFTAAFFHRWYFGTPKLEKVLRNGFKLGFTNNWEMWDKSDCEVPFQVRTLLPLYQHFGPNEKPKYKRSPESKKSYRSYLHKYDFNVDVDNVHLSNLIVGINDGPYVKTQFTIYVEKTRHNYILMTGVNYQLEDGGMFEMNVKIMLVKDDLVYLSGEGTRLISEYQCTLGLVVGVLDDDLLQSIRDGKMSIIIHQTQWSTTDEKVKNKMKFYNEEKKSIEVCLTMPGPTNDSEWLKLAKNAQKCGEEIPKPQHNMHGQPSGWLICRNGKIGVSKEYLSHQCDYFDTLFFGTQFSDCGGATVKVDEEVKIVLCAMNIIYHRSEILDVKTFERVMILGDLWLCPIIKNYIELALMTTDQVPEEDKIIVACDHNLEVINYILRNPQYANPGFNIKTSPTTVRKICRVNDNELDAGKVPEVHEVINLEDNDDSKDQPGCSSAIPKEKDEYNIIPGYFDNNGEFRHISPTRKRQATNETGEKKKPEDEAGPSTSSAAKKSK